MNETTAQELAQQLGTQMRKGMLVYCVLLLCSNGKMYSSEIIIRLREAQLLVVEGTLYPLLNRLGRDRLLQYEWQESEQGPPRKYYWLTEAGEETLKALAELYHAMDTSVKTLEKGM